MRKLIMLLLACGCINAMASQVRMTPFLTTQSLKENLNSKDTAKYISAMSYIGGVADLLIKHGKICPPEGATSSTRKSINFFIFILPICQCVV